MTPEEMLLAEVESIINGASERLSDSRKEQHLHSLPYLAEAAEKAIRAANAEVTGVHLFALAEAPKEEMTEASFIDGSQPTPEDFQNPDLIGVHFQYVQGFQGTDDASEVFSDPETAVALEGTMPDAGVFMVINTNGEKVHTLFAGGCLAVRRFQGSESFTFYLSGQNNDADDFFAKVGCSEDTAQCIKALTAFRVNPRQLRIKFPETFRVMYEGWKAKMREQEDKDE